MSASTEGVAPVARKKVSSRQHTVVASSAVPTASSATTHTLASSIADDVSTLNAQEVLARDSAA